MQGDCLERMTEIPDGSIDMVMTDPPYGTTACKWDSVIPFAPMWEQLKRVTKKQGAIVLLADQPFTSALITSNIEMFKYCWVWNKNMPTGFPFAKRQPMRSHSDIVVFYSQQCVYNPIYQDTKSETIKEFAKKGTRRTNRATISTHTIMQPRASHKAFREKVNPTSSQFFDVVPRRAKRYHASQKPIALMGYMIRTYTNEGDTVLDFTMGSGTTGVACKNLNRKFIGIELGAAYFEIAKQRIESHVVTERQAVLNGF